MLYKKLIQNKIRLNELKSDKTEGKIDHKIKNSTQKNINSLWKKFKRYEGEKIFSLYFLFVKL